MAMQAGLLDRVFNSTFSLPQQLLWRMYRVMEDDNVDLFSEEGLADAALIPLLGFLDDHQNDVMPDYMAKQMGMALLSGRTALNMWVNFLITRCTAGEY